MEKLKSAKSDDSAVIVAPQREVAIPPRSTSVMPVIDVAELINKAVDSKSAVEVVKELRMMLLDDQKRAAEAAFNEAMSAFQAECPVIQKGKTVLDKMDKKLYSYAPIEKIEEVIRPIERKNGFSHTFDQDVESQPGWVIAKCIITHQQGHQRISVSKFPLGSKTSIMSDTQVYAGALTFANRRTLANAYGLVVAGEDKDGATSGQKPPNPSSLQPSEPSVELKALAQELWTLLKSVRGDKKDWVIANKYLWANEILDGAVPEIAPDLSVSQFKKAIEKVKSKNLQ